MDCYWANRNSVDVPRDSSRIRVSNSKFEPVAWPLASTTLVSELLFPPTAVILGNFLISIGNKLSRCGVEVLNKIIAARDGEGWSQGFCKRKTPLRRASRSTPTRSHSGNDRRSLGCHSPQEYTGSLGGVAERTKLNWCVSPYPLIFPV